MSTKPSVILDIGSYSIKAGLSTSYIPDFVLPNAVGRAHRRISPVFYDHRTKDIMISDEIKDFRAYLDVSYPMNHGFFENIDDESIVLDYIFRNKLCIDNNDHPILIAEPFPCVSIESRKRLTEVLFETFNFPMIQIVPQPLLVLYAQGLVTGIVVDSGHSYTSVVPIAESNLLNHLVGTLDISGNDITERLIQLLAYKGYVFREASMLPISTRNQKKYFKTIDREFAREMKEKVCFVSVDLENDRQIANETTYYAEPFVLPDKQKINISDERFEAPEILFNPKLIGLDQKGLSDLLYDTIMKSDINLRHKFFERIVLSGGNTMFPGLPSRLSNDLENMVLNRNNEGEKYTIIVDIPHTRFLSFEGATVLAKLIEQRANSWVHRMEYDDFGVDNIIRRWQSLE